MNLVFDDSFDGFLTAVFEAYAQSYAVSAITARRDFVPDFLREHIDINTSAQKSERVWNKLKALFGRDNYMILWAFLSEQPDIYTHIYHIIRQKIKQPEINILNHHTDASVASFHRAIKIVGRERHRMQAFVRFELMVGGVYFAKVSPDFNVLPLIGRFFARRFADQSWLIFDEKRYFGIYYDKQTRQLTEVVDVDAFILAQPKKHHDEVEVRYQHLWQTYFKHVTIAERKNLRHHIQQMPKRYWRYLTEKQAI